MTICLLPRYCFAFIALFFLLYFSLVYTQNLSDNDISNNYQLSMDDGVAVNYSEDDMNVFSLWLYERGLRVFGDVELRRSGRGCYYMMINSSRNAYNDPVSLREVLVNIPLSSGFSVRTLSDGPLRDLLRDSTIFIGPDDGLALALLAEKFRGRISPYEPYVRYLRQCARRSPLLFDTSKLDLLRGTPLFLSTTKRLQDISESYNRIMEVASDKHSAIFSWGHPYTWEEFLWAHAAISSHIVDYTSPDNIKEKYVIPFFDLLTPSTTTNNSFIQSLSPAKEGMLSVYSKLPMKLGPLLIFVGNLSDEEMILRHGVIDVESFEGMPNPFDKIPVDIKLASDEPVPLVNKKIALLAQVGIQTTDRHHLERRGISKEFLIHLRVKQMTALDIPFSKMIVTGYPISPINEYRTLREIYSFCDDRRKYFEMTRSHDIHMEEQARLTKNIDVVLIMSQRRVSRQLYSLCLSHVESLWMSLLVKGLRPNETEFGDLVRESFDQSDILYLKRRVNSISIAATSTRDVSHSSVPS